MSFDATRWAWMQKLTATEKLVLLCMADRAGRQHTCWPSTLRLSKDTNLTERTIFNILNRLEASGAIRREVRPGRSTIYHLIGVTGREMGNAAERGVKRGGGKALHGQRSHQAEAAPCTALPSASGADHPCTTCRPPLNDVHLESLRESHKESREWEARPQALAHTLASACALTCATGSQAGGQAASTGSMGKTGSMGSTSSTGSMNGTSGRKPAAKRAPRDCTPKMPHGEHAHVLLTEAEHAKLMTSYGKEWTDEAITLLDLHIDAGGKDNYISHCAALQKWVFDAINERRLKLRMTPFTRPASSPSSSSASVWASSLPTGPTGPISPISPTGSSSFSCSSGGAAPRQASIKQAYDYEPTPEELMRNREAARNIRQKYFRHREESA